jgi:hypothetical protein
MPNTRNHERSETGIIRKVYPEMNFCIVDSTDGKFVYLIELDELDFKPRARRMIMFDVETDNDGNVRPVNVFEISRNIKW